MASCLAPVTVEPADLQLRPPRAGDEPAFLNLVADFRRHGEALHADLPLPPQASFAAYLDGPAPTRQIWAFDPSDGAVLGLAMLRPRLSGPMAEVGGHVGLRVRPTMRRRGVGSRLFAHTLQEARAHGLAHVLVVCAPDNLASQALARQQGGVFEREASVEGVMMLRYWVPTPAA